MQKIKTGGGLFEVSAEKINTGAIVKASGKWRGEASSFSVEFRNAEPDSSAYLAKLETVHGYEVEGFGFGEGSHSNYERGSIFYGLNPRIWRDMETGEVRGWSVYSRYYSDAWSSAKRKALYLIIESALDSLDFLSADAMQETEKNLKKQEADMILREVARLRESAQINLAEAEAKEEKANAILKEIGA